MNPVDKREHALRLIVVELFLPEQAMTIFALDNSRQKKSATMLGNE